MSDVHRLGDGYGQYSMECDFTSAQPLLKTDLRNVYTKGTTMIRAGIFLAIVTLTASLSQAGTLSFRDWKGRRVLEAKSAMTFAQKNRSLTGIQKIRRIGAAHLRVQAALELTPNDYFHLYVLPVHGDNRAALKQIVGKLNKSELAEIVSGYVDQTQRVQKMPRPTLHRVGAL